MSDHTPSAAAGISSEEPLLDSLLREAVPEIKLALGDLIDRDNARALPDRYAKLLPETTVAVTLRPDAADALLPVAPELERELTDSCNRHGSLYDRGYRVKLRRADSRGAPLFRVSTLSEKDAQAPASLAPPPGTAPGTGAAPPAEAARMPGPAAPVEPTIMAPPAAAVPPPTDPDATRIEGIAPPALEPGRFALVVEEEDGTELATHPLGDVLTTVGRRSEDPALRSTVSLDGASHVSRRQVALVWDPRGGKPGFRVYNLGLNALHAGGKEIPGANAGKGPLRLEAVTAASTAWVAPGEAMRIGEHGPVLRVRESAEADRGGEVPEDPDATRFE
jgi:hypothetical protein